MARKRVQKAATKSKGFTPKPEPYVLRGKPKAGETENERHAELMIEGLAMNAVVGVTFSSTLGELDLTECFSQLLIRARKVTERDTKSQEAILAGQVVSLNALYTNLAMTARQNASNAVVFERLMRLALKAQSNCRSTAEALAAIQNPPTVFARQANFANGPQQINNGASPVPVSRARNSELEPNRLLEANGEGLDSGTSSEAGYRDSCVEAVEAVNRPANRKR